MPEWTQVCASKAPWAPSTYFPAQVPHDLHRGSALRGALQYVYQICNAGNFWQCSELFAIRRGFKVQAESSKGSVHAFQTHGSGKTGFNPFVSKISSNIYLSISLPKRYLQREPSCDADLSDCWSLLTEYIMQKRCSPGAALC